ncbi:helix-turn-helix domain-containing protein [Amycolatopsis carbonis]|uniref:Helix-turn-helix domain-containing protein n=1 Tax=Amycolatopsis carbonis TaxID=715471 RepID=A0A9Y2IF97_9PSEU|nr:helix-turn-helix domain-containing protein [Amycolatopsis sp. 2-15]WIX78394.1 helix-turn-helix domain-containing protein [Amycolatopsis sp. 2-15]
MAGRQYWCPVELTVDVVGGRWKPVILAHLKEGVHRYGELRRRMPAISEKMLTQQLRELTTDGLVHRQALDGRVPHVEYRLTPDGEALGPALTALTPGANAERRQRGSRSRRRPDASGVPRRECRGAYAGPAAVS